jgi:SAM-dependent methyltransferase
MSTSSEAAWADFWSGSGAGPESGCLPDGLRRIDAVQSRIWAGVVRPLARKARVLDLATGDGAVLGKIGKARGDLKLIGVDSSPVLPAGPKAARLMPGVTMEALPFPDGSFDLVTSQFGFEYGDTKRIAAEVRRVLREGGNFAFIIHHADGAIVAHNRGRSEALRWAARESGLLDKAAAVANSRKLVQLPTPRHFRDAPIEARRRFPRQSVAEEFATAVLQTLDMGSRHPPGESLQNLATLRGKAINEIARIEALCAAARDNRQIARLADQLKSAGLTAQAPVTLHEQEDGRPFAWLITGSRNDTVI